MDHLYLVIRHPETGLYLKDIDLWASSRADAWKYSSSQVVFADAEDAAACVFLITRDREIEVFSEDFV